jgi:hypothetical protein
MDKLNSQSSEDGDHAGETKASIAFLSVDNMKKGRAAVYTVKHVKNVALKKK